MDLDIVILKSEFLYNKIKDNFKEYEVIFLPDIMLLGDVLSNKHMHFVIGSNLKLEYVEAVLRQIYSDRLNWHLNMYIDERDIKLSGLDPLNILNAYIKLLENNRYLNDAVYVKKLAEDVSRRDLISGDFILEYISNIPVIKDTERCIAFDSCRICIKSCPYEAIKNVKPPEIDLDECMECGYCINTCPSLLYVYPMLPLSTYELFLKSLRWSGDENKFIIIVDSLKRMEFYKFLDRDKFNAVSVHLCNSLYFSIFHIIISLIHGYLPIIYTDFNREAFKEYTILLKEFSKIFVNEPLIINNLNRLNLKEYKYPINTSYEDFYSSNLNKMISASSKLFKKDDKWIGYTSLPFFDINIDEDKCTLCEACVRNCPTHALEIESNGDIRLLFSHQKCIGCERCIDSCPEDAIDIVKRVNPSLLSNGKYILKASSKVAYCISCGAPIGSEKYIKRIEDRLRESGVDEEYIKSVRYCKKCKFNLYFKSIYKG